LTDAAGTGHLGTGLGDLNEDFLFVSSVTFHRLHIVRDKVITALELVFHLCPRRFYTLVQGHEAVVGPFQVEQRDHYNEYDDYRNDQ
jgi:hypothetical protein